MTKRSRHRLYRFHSFLRRLRAGGRSNMYGAVPYLMRRFDLDRDTAFRVICDWVDAQDAAELIGAAGSVRPARLPQRTPASAPSFAETRPRNELVDGTTFAFQGAVVIPFPTRGPYEKQCRSRVVDRRSVGHRLSAPGSANRGRRGGPQRAGRQPRGHPRRVFHLPAAGGAAGRRSRAAADSSSSSELTATGRPSTGPVTATVASRSTLGTAATTTVW